MQFSDNFLHLRLRLLKLEKGKLERRHRIQKTYQKTVPRETGSGGPVLRYCRRIRSIIRRCELLAQDLADGGVHGGELHEAQSTVAGTAKSCDPAADN